MAQMATGEDHLRMAERLETSRESRVIPAALLGATFLIVKDWIVAPPTDVVQIAAFTSFAISMPLYALVLGTIRVEGWSDSAIPGWLFSPPRYGAALATVMGLTLSFWFASWSVGAAFMVTAVVAFVLWNWWLRRASREYIAKAADKRL